MWNDESLIAPLSICSFDETSMDSCILATIDESRRVSDLSGESMKDSNEVEVTSLEEAKSVIAALRARQRAQAHQMLAWRRTLKLQVSFNYRGGISTYKGSPTRRLRLRWGNQRRGKEGGRGEGRARNDRSKLLPLKTIKHARHTNRCYGQWNIRYTVIHLDASGYIFLPLCVADEWMC